MAGWQSLSVLQQVFWVLAILSSSFFLISNLMALLGFDGFETDIDHDVSVSSTGEIFEFLSFRNFVAFTLGFSWAGILFYPQVKSISLVLAILVGIAFMVLNQWLIKKLRGLESSGNSNLNRAIGQEATVSVQIDAQMQGKGKVVVRVGEREIEALAVTEDTQSLRRGQKVQVYNVEKNLMFVSSEDKLGIRSL